MKKRPLNEIIEITENQIIETISKLLHETKQNRTKTYINKPINNYWIGNELLNNYVVIVKEIYIKDWD